MKLQKVTIWKRFYDDNIFKHNHKESGWVENDKPIPKSKAQKCWNNYDWQKQFGWLDSNSKIII